MRSAILFILVLFSLNACGRSPDNTPLSGKPGHHVAGGFRNLYVKDPEKTFFTFLKMRYFGDTPWADHASMAEDVPHQPVDLSKISKPTPEQTQVTWLGHSTFLIQKNGLNILTDPVFADHVSPLDGFGPERYTPHVMDYKDLPKIDYVIISHNHYDHLDKTATRQLGNSPHYLVPLGLSEWYLDQGVSPDRVTEFDWWDAKSYENLSVQALPSQHWSARGLNDRRKTLWVSWSLMINGEKIWFAGDTGYNPIQFKEIGQKAGPFDLALIPIGAYEPRWFMSTYHVNPQEALKIHKDIRAKKSIGMHWGTFPLTAEAPLEPVYELVRKRPVEGVGEKEFDTMIIGESRYF